jgi:hypothetical protein
MKMTMDDQVLLRHEVRALMAIAAAVNGSLSQEDASGWYRFLALS